MTIKKAVVIGAGVMGAGIAAQLANAGIEVEMLDIVPRDLPEGGDRDVIAKSALEKLLKNKPAALMHKRNAKLIRPGNTEDHMDRLKDADLIIEAVIENSKIKSNLFKKIDEHRKPGSIVGSNTSTIPLKTLKDGQSDAMKKDMVITHFFNPPRYMPLMELVYSTDNNPDTVARLEDFIDKKLGKTVIHCNDTPGFIANRVGTYWLTVSMREAMKAGLTPEEADAVVGKPMGIPKSGIFGLVDMVGLDLVPYIGKSLYENVPANDDFKNVHEDIALVQKMIEQGYTGRKGKGGFYRMNKEGGKKQLEVVDLYADEITYSPVKKPKMQSAKRAKKGGLKGLIKGDDAESKYAWEVLKQTLTYAANMIPEIHDDVFAIDEAMKLGYNWKRGPFEMLDKIGVDYFIKRLEKDGVDVPPALNAARGKKFYKTINGQLNTLSIDTGEYQPVKRPDGVLLLSDVKRGSKPVAKNMSASLWDIGDGVLCLEFTSTANSLNPNIMRMINKACDKIESGKGGYKALVIHNEGQHFSVGANIKLAEIAAKAKQYWAIEKMVRSGQDTYKRLKFANFPVVAAPHNMAVGGGCEILLHADAVQAHAETYTGLVETGVGLIPGWGGCAEMLRRNIENKKRPNGPMPPLTGAFETIAMAKVSTSAEEARSMLMLNENSGITMNKARLLADAKAKALKMVDDGYTPPEPATFRLPGPSGRAAAQLAVNDMYKRGFVSSYGVVLTDQLGEILSGGQNADVVHEVSEDDIRELEVQAFMRLVRDQRTMQRVAHMLKKNKALDMNSEFLKEDAKLDVTVDELRRSLKGSTSLSGQKNKPSKALLKKLEPSFNAASNILKGKSASNNNAPVEKAAPKEDKSADQKGKAGQATPSK